VTGWITSEAIALCREIEAACPAFGCHVALTGGLLYKIGERKDADLLFYRIRQIAEIDVVGLFCALRRIGIILVQNTSSNGFCVKATWRGRRIDFFFPEVESGSYPTADTEPGAPFLLLADTMEELP
jgi:hypothetical protein